MNVTIIINVDVEEQETLDSIGVLLDNTLPYMCDNVVITHTINNTMEVDIDCE